MTKSYKKLLKKKVAFDFLKVYVLLQVQNWLKLPGCHLIMWNNKSLSFKGKQNVVETDSTLCLLLHLISGL